MSVAVFVGVLALVLAASIVVTAIRRHQRDGGKLPSWADVKEAFSSVAIRDVREEAAMLSEPSDLESDLRVSELLELSEEGSGYIRPHDILAPRASRH